MGKYLPFLTVPAGLFLPPPHTESIVPFLAPTAAHAVLSLRSRAAALTCIPFGICSPLRIASWEARTGIQGIQGSQGSQEPKNRKTHQVTWLGARVSLLRFGNGSLAAPPGLSRGDCSVLGGPGAEPKSGVSQGAALLSSVYGQIKYN